VLRIGRRSNEVLERCSCFPFGRRTTLSNMTRMTRGKGDRRMNGHAISRQPERMPSAQYWFTHWAVLFLLSLLTLTLANTICSRADQGEVVSGVLEFVSLESNTVRLRNPLGQPIILKIRKPHLLDHVTVGDHVTVVVNEDHEIMKLIETPIPELSPPNSQ
jgi:hypothetical protein